MTKEGLMRMVVCAGLALTASVMIAGRCAQVSSAALPAQQQGDKPVEQTRKNIKVLKGLPESQLFPLMNFISVSLGVKCGFCHVSQGKDPKTGNTNWVWESDDKPEKNTARQMMQMVLALNHSQGYGLDPGAVSCYTCHRGANRPQSQPVLPLAASGHEAGPAPSPSPAGAPTPAPTREALPTVQQVFDKYVAAVGGQEAASKFQTQVVKGTRDASQGRSWPFEATSNGPDKFLMVVQVPQFGTVSQAVNGGAGWVSNPRATRALSASELAELKNAAQLFDVIKFRPTATMRSVGRHKLGDRDAYIVVDRPSEGVSRRYYFDAQTGLLLRITTLTDTVLSPLPEQIDFEDYRDVDGLKIPFVTRVSNIDTFNSYTRTITEIRHGVAVQDKLFDMPPAPASTPKP
ncbi:MAG: c-type cytochrome [Acidobacteria bacterium]|nr:MAG: c-type cytochrome [Acidobacteriota bacterium]